MRYYLPLPTVEIILNKLQYDPETGIFTNRRNGRRVGFLNAQGYCLVKIGRHDYMAHRLAYKIMTGQDPPADIDHKVTRSTNRWVDIRAASESQNRWNAATPVNNTSGYKGVHRSKRSGKWSARIGIHGTRHFLGWFNTAEEAAAVYQQAALELHGEFVHNTVVERRFDEEPKRLYHPIGISGHRGITKHGNNWQATYRRKTLGTFGTIEEAAQAYQSALIDPS